MNRCLILPVFALMFTGLLFGQNNENETTIVQIGPHSSYDFFQDGTLNTIYIEQAGSHYASVSQTGNSNEATITHLSGSESGTPSFPPGNPGGPPPFSGNLGHSSHASIVQTGDFNETEITQTGSHHAEIKQEGNSNSADIEQKGSGGNGEGSGIPFHPPGNPDVCPPPFAPCGEISTDTGSIAFIYQEGSENAASISQNGHSHFASINQNGSGNQAVIIQNGTQNASSSNGQGSFTPGNGNVHGNGKARGNPNR